MNDEFYFPLLRGKTYECLAVRQMLERNGLSPLISPIFEPVSQMESLVRVAEAAEKAGRAFGVIINPNVGPMSGLPLDNEFYLNVRNFANKFGWRIYVRVDGPNLSQALANYGLSSADKVGFVVGDAVDVFMASDYIDSDPALRRAYYVGDAASLQDLDVDYRIRINDFFPKKPSNADYKNESIDVIPPYYLSAKRNRMGFSDYSVIGNNYSESGMGPIAITIHIVFPTSNGRMSLIHFTSYSDATRKDPGARFYDAANSFAKWNEETGHLTNLAAKELLSYHEGKKFPGLGSLKRLQIQQHFEILTEVLQKNETKDIS